VEEEEAAWSSLTRGELLQLVTIIHRQDPGKLIKNEA